MKKKIINPNWSEEAILTIPFHDIDSLNIVWHGNHLKYFEIARTNLFKKINYDVEQMKLSNIMWPIVEAHIKYIKPILYDATIRVQANIISYEYKLKIEYNIFNQRANEKICKGYTIQVPVNPQTRTMVYQTPPILLKKLGLC